MTLRERAFDLTSGDLRLEAALREGDGEFAAVVLHPHPRYGGDMHNHVVTALCGVFAGLGATTLRFNTRGAGRSDGDFDNGRGERDDAIASAAALRQFRPGAKLILAGYSFGAAIAAAAADAIEPALLLLVSPPMPGLPPLVASMPTLLVTGEYDQIAPPWAVEAAAAAAAARVIVIPGAGHGWWPGVEQLTDAVRAFVATSLELSAREPAG